MDKEQLLYLYFSNKLTAEQERVFNELLLSDPKFKEQYDFERNLQNVIRDKETKDLKQKLIGFEKDISQSIPVRTLKPNYQKWSIAASIVLLAALGWIAYSSLSGPNYNDLYESNFQEYPNTVFTITRGENTGSIEREAFVAYEVGEYLSAISNFKKIPLEEREGYVDFYLGLSHLRMGQLAEARQFFQQVISSDDTFIAEAHWYLALTYLKEENKDKAISELKKLLSKHDYNKARAEALLAELE